MSPTSLVVAMPNTPERARILAGLQKIPDFRIIAVTSDLMNTYNVVEEREPKAVLIADAFGRLPEFEVMRAVFNQLDVRWLVVSGFATGETRVSDWTAAKSGLFELDLGTPISSISQSLISLVHSEQSKKHAPTTGAIAAKPSSAKTRKILIAHQPAGLMPCWKFCPIFRVPALQRLWYNIPDTVLEKVWPRCWNVNAPRRSFWPRTVCPWNPVKLS